MGWATEGSAFSATKSLLPSGNLPEEGFSFNAAKTPLPSGIRMTWDPAVYRKDAALLALDLSTAAYSSGMHQASVRLFDRYLALGVPRENISLYGYPGHENNRTDLSWSNEDAYSFAIGHRRAGRATLLLLTFRGTGPSTPYTNTLSDPGLDSVPFVNIEAHNRFYAFYELALEGLRDHLARHPELYKAAAEGSLRILVTGHSLGGAVANLLGAALTNEEIAKGLFPEVLSPASLPGSLYVYTFACARTFHSGGGTAPLTGDCRGIFNLLIEEDPVTHLPRDGRLSRDETWMRFGPSLTFSAASSGAAYEDGFSFHSPENYRAALLTQEPTGPSEETYFGICVSR